MPVESMVPEAHDPRVCGTCTVCCVATAIEPLEKPAGVRCQHLTTNGCGVYAQRPNDPRFIDCIEFRCLWLNGMGVTSDRPDQIGAAFMEKPDPDSPGKKRIHALEVAPGSARHPRVRQLIDQFLAGGQTVIVANPQTVLAIKPNGSAWRYAIDPNDALRTQVDSRTPPVRLMVRGKPVAGSNADL